MQTIARITADAVQKEHEGRKFWTFDLAENFSYKQKDGSYKEFTTFYNCSYWTNADLSKLLKKGTLVLTEGRAEARAWLGENNTAKAAINLIIDRLKVLSYVKGDPHEEETTPENSSWNVDEADLPF